MTDTDTNQTALEGAIEAYFEAWNETDDATRAAHVATAFTVGARYVDPLSDATGHDAIAAAMGDTHQQYPGITVERTSGIDAHHDVIRFTWSITASDGSLLVEGIDVARTEGGQLADVRGFFGREVT